MLCLIEGLVNREWQPTNGLRSHQAPWGSWPGVSWTAPGKREMRFIGSVPPCQGPLCGRQGGDGSLFNLSQTKPEDIAKIIVEEMITANTFTKAL
jgi:hypothetical protein